MIIFLNYHGIAQYLRGRDCGGIVAWSESMICAHAIASLLAAATFKRLVRRDVPFDAFHRRSIRVRRSSSILHSAIRKNTGKLLNFFRAIGEYENPFIEVTHLKHTCINYIFKCARL